MRAEMTKILRVPDLLVKARSLAPKLRGVLIMWGLKAARLAERAPEGLGKSGQCREKRAGESEERC